MLIDFLHAGPGHPGRGIPFSDMFAMTEYPKDVLPLYAQGHSLSVFLIGQKGKHEFLNFLADGMADENWPRAIRAHYGYGHMLALQTSWLDWVKSGRPELHPALDGRGGERDAASIALHQTAITARKGQQRHQPGLQAGPLEMRLKGKQIGRGGVLLAHRKYALGVPGTAGGDHHLRLNLAAVIQSAKRAQLVAPKIRDFHRLQQAGARLHRGVAQHHVQMLASQRPAPDLLARSRQHRRARPSTDAHHGRTGRCCKGLGNAAGRQNRHGGGRDELSTNFAAGKFRLLHQGDAPARLGQKLGRGRAGRAGADDDRVKPHGR